MPSLNVSRLGTMRLMSCFGLGPGSPAKRACEAEEASEYSPGTSTAPCRSPVGNGNMHRVFAKKSVRRLKPVANQVGAEK